MPIYFILRLASILVTVLIVAYSPTPRFLGDLVDEVAGAHLVRGERSTVVRGITQDSRRVVPGSSPMP